jgi:23S rRNA (guanosine2251-2'-O)-methyltransferase
MPTVTRIKNGARRLKNNKSGNVFNIFPLYTFEEKKCIIAFMKKSEDKKRVFLILHNIRSVHNVGSIFRTADAAGVSKLYLTGYTSAPVDRFGRKRNDIAKTALGAEASVEWERAESISSLIKKLKKEKTAVIAVEQGEDAIDYKRLKVKYPAAFVFGNEVQGLSKTILMRCDAIAEIPMRGKKESLNISVAAGIFIFRVLNI